jgi:hypothetical protein
MEGDLWDLRDATEKEIAPDAPEPRAWLLDRGAVGRLRAPVERILRVPHHPRPAIFMPASITTIKAANVSIPGYASSWARISTAVEVSLTTARLASNHLAL